MSRLAVSVIIPTYNRGHLLGRALRSVAAECNEFDEIIVVDDGSTDNTAEVVAAFSQTKYLQGAHGGAGKARNIGIEASKNPLVTFLDSDDEWLPGALTLKRALLEKREDLVFCFSNFAGTVRDGGMHHGALIWWHQDVRPWDEILGPSVAFSSIAPLPNGSPDICVHIGHLARNEMTANYVAANTVVVRKECAGDALGFPEDLPTYEDWECFGRLSLKGKCAYLDIETAIQHFHSGSRLTDASRLQRATARITTLKRVWGLDRAFLQANRELYERTLFLERKARVRNLLLLGRTNEARAEIAGESGWPIGYRLSLLVPGEITTRLVEAARWLKASIRRRTFQSK